jgi:hypothetical protein
MLATIDFPGFRPHPLLADAHLMTLAGALPRAGLGPFAVAGEERIFRVDGTTRILARCNWQPRRHAAPTLLLAHGLVGDARAGYMLGTAAKAFAAGFNTVRLNTRNCGGTEQLTRTSYHGGLTADLRAVGAHLADEGHRRIHLAGFSLGGNMVLKLAGELGHLAPRWLSGVVAVSPCIDFAAAAESLNRGVLNRIYQQRFVLRLKRILRNRHQLAPLDVGIEGLAAVRTLRELDDRFTSRLAGFRDVDDYYARASALPYMPTIRVPALVVTAVDDPLVPFASFQRPEVTANPAIRVLASQRGGHTSFIARAPSASRIWQDRDRYWAENRIVQFCLELSNGRG